MPNILLVEDDEHLSAVLIDLLEENHYQVEAVSRGDEAVARAQKRTFNLLLTDVRIQGPQDGISALEAIQKIQPGIRCIIMTGYADAEVPLRASRLRAEDYLHKPFNLKTLLQAISAVLERESPPFATSSSASPRLRPRPPKKRCAGFLTPSCKN